MPGASPYLLPTSRVPHAQDFNTLAMRVVNPATPATPVRGQLRSLDAGSSTSMGIEVYYGATTGWLPPWNLPWGEVASVVDGVNRTITTLADIFTATWTVPCANRQYEASAFCAVSSTVAADQIDLFFTDASNLSYVGGYYRTAVPFSGSVWSVNWTTSWLFPAAGLATVKVRGQRASGTGTVTTASGTFANAILVVKDIGPNGAPPAS